MSSRQLRKLQKQKELGELQADVADQEESGADDVEPAPKAKANPFSGFAALGEDDGGEDDKDDNEEEDEQEPAETTPLDDPPAVTTPKSAKKNKKKKKKAKKATEAAEKGALTKDTGKAASSVDDDKDQDEIDRALRELDLKAGASASNKAASPEARAYERICELLRVNTHHLKVLNEMRNLFGREAMAAAQAEEVEEEEARRRQRNRRTQAQNVDLETYLKAAPGKSLPEVTLRRNPFLAGKETWPRASTEGLSMKQVKEGEGTAKAPFGAVEFAFSHDSSGTSGYYKLENTFFSLIQMHDPMVLVHFLYEHPYHVSTLIQVSKIAKQDQNNALSADLCERALFTLGRVSLSAFRQKLEEGKARLEFRRPENRQFWLAGYHYLKSLVQKGTYRTGLEWAKLLLSMDLSDPYGIVNFLHPLAIRAHESKWFIDLCDSEALDKCDTAQDYVRQTLVLARLQQNDVAGAKALLIEGMERLPWLYGSLFQALNLDSKGAIWGSKPRGEHEELFTAMYVHQTKQLWDNAQATGLLKEAMPLATKATPAPNSLPEDPHVKVLRNTARFVYLDNTPSLMALVPDGLLYGYPNWDCDPLPPPEEENIFSQEMQRRPWKRDPEDMGDVDDALPRLLQRLQRVAAGPRHPQDINPEDMDPQELAALQMLAQEGQLIPGQFPDEEDGGRPEEDDDDESEGLDDDGATRPVGLWSRLANLIRWEPRPGDNLDLDDHEVETDEEDEDVMPELEPPDQHH